MVKTQSVVRGYVIEEWNTVYTFDGKCEIVVVRSEIIVMCELRRDLISIVEP